MKKKKKKSESNEFMQNTSDMPYHRMEMIIGLQQALHKERATSCVCVKRVRKQWENTSVASKGKKFWEGIMQKTPLRKTEEMHKI